MITFKNECSIKGMKKLEDQSVDLIVTDPPYNIADINKVTKQGGKFISTKKAWGDDFQDKWNSFEEYYEWLKPFFAEMKRVLKDDGSMIVFLDRNFASVIGYLLQKDFGLIVKNKLYFQKTNPTIQVCRNNYRSSVEEAIWISKSPKCKINFINQTEMKQVFSGAIGKTKNKRIHPCQKYNWMIEPLIERHSQPGDVVLDPFAGSGSTLRIAAAMGRKAIGFEKSTAFYKAAFTELFGVVAEPAGVAVNDSYISDDHIVRIRAKQIVEEMMKKYNLQPA
ncbi:TPA: site-specific DNA-methyltransferase [Pseudomonas aeruginosa]